MKKILALIIALVLCMSFVACGGSGNSQENADNLAIVKFVENNKSELLSSMEKSFATSSGMTCESDIEVEGDGFIITIKIDQLEDVDDSTKEQLQTAYDALDATFEGMLEDMQKEVEELEYYQIKVCDKNGDLLAKITAGDK